ncbi:hypothetical protein ColTof4_12193 [Colletotrichum tofieldiae]|nr:hypothetical protein ColTof3_05605 [Colletotrichum tofieldiae]GKT79770.1 hypothetical protein ColTof4_12193 [Colletotrichum tofieldiae]GKT84344.1 hypothetical protein Ct61P_02194 [Colletotrichum tofieldiae]
MDKRIQSQQYFVEGGELLHQLCHDFPMVFETLNSVIQNFAGLYRGGDDGYESRRYAQWITHGWQI